ncbi:MAG TPA: cytochrome P450 [Streptosporangiaceae bacterium]|nr:cytochrome P450 [Streptosporangiaceae bacterium]
MLPEAIYEALLEPGGAADPYPLYAALHEHGSVVQAGEGLVLVPGYRAVRSILSDQRFVVDDAEIFDRGDADWRDHPVLNAPNLLSLNGAGHDRIRGLMAPWFTRQRVRALAPMVSAQVDRLLDEMALAGRDGGPVDFIAGFAYALPAAVICELIGATGWDLVALRGLSSQLSAVLEPEIDEDILAEGDAAAVTLAGMFSELVAERRARPRDDLVSELTALVDSPDVPISQGELVQNLILLLSAGIECSMNVHGSALHIVFTQAGVADSLRSGQVAPAAFVEEVLRFESPVQDTGRRLAGGGELDGVEVDCDDEIMLLIGAANRDPRRFSDPDLFRPERTDPGALSFGAGRHFCLGAALARLEAEVGFARLLRRFPRICPAGQADRRPSLTSRGFDRMPVSLS